MSEELKRHKEALEVAVELLRLYSCQEQPQLHWSTASERLRQINAILHPEPEYEDVDVETWAVVFPDNRVSVYAFSKQVKAEEYAKQSGGEATRFTGTLRRPKPVKLERSVTVEVRSDEDGDLFWDDEDGDGDYPLRKHPDAHNKRGTLVFTWTE